LKFLRRSFIPLISIVLCQSCNLSPAVTPVSTVDPTDFSKYIAIGDSQTAGYADGGLYREAQLSSYPNILAGQLKAAGGGQFDQPLFSEAQANGSGYLKLIGFTADGLPVTASVTDKLAVRSNDYVPGYGYELLYTKYTGNNSNLGVPNMKVENIADPTYGNVNSYYERLLSNVPPNNTVNYHDFAASTEHSFFTCWLGANDVYAYALTGATANHITYPDTFLQLYSLLINGLTANNQKGALATIPDVACLPYFNAITVNAVNAKIKRTYPTAALYITARTSQSISIGRYSARLATDDDMILISFDASKLGQMISTPSGMQPYGLSVDAPIAMQDVLDANEHGLINGLLTSYNSSIKLIAATKRLAIFDANLFFTQLQKGMVVNGVTVSTNLTNGGVFSLDGVHLTPRGNALEANEFIKAINTRYKTKLKPVDISTYSGTKTL
jgi:hypothetical protein